MSLFILLVTVGRYWDHCSPLRVCAHYQTVRRRSEMCGAQKEMPLKYTLWGQSNGSSSTSPSLKTMHFQLQFVPIQAVWTAAGALSFWPLNDSTLVVDGSAAVCQHWPIRAPLSFPFSHSCAAVSLSRHSASLCCVSCFAQQWTFAFVIAKYDIRKIWIRIENLINNETQWMFVSKGNSK